MDRLDNSLNQDWKEAQQKILEDWDREQEDMLSGRKATRGTKVKYKSRYVIKYSHIEAILYYSKYKILDNNYLLMPVLSKNSIRIDYYQRKFQLSRDSRVYQIIQSAIKAKREHLWIHGILYPIFQTN